MRRSKRRAEEEEAQEDATHQVTWSRAPSQSGRDPATPGKFDDIKYVRLAPATSSRVYSARGKYILHKRLHCSTM